MKRPGRDDFDDGYQPEAVQLPHGHDVLLATIELQVGLTEEAGFWLGNNHKPILNRTMRSYPLKSEMRAEPRLAFFGPNLSLVPEPLHPCFDGRF